MKKLVPMLALCLVFFNAARAQSPMLRLEEFADGLDHPLDIENAGDSRLFVVEQTGRIVILEADGGQLAAPFLDISDEVLFDFEEQGLLGMAFDPDYASNGFFYVNYTDLNGDTHIARFKVDPSNPDQADPSSETLLIFVDQPFANHNGGCLKFGPDGYLYIGLGDGGDAGDPFNNAQDPTTFLGKLLRIDVHSGDPYGIPGDNPFVNVSGYLPEIWATGLRNPFRFSFDALTGDLWIGDVGQNRYEEIDFQSANSPGGENYGWDCFEAKHRFQPNDCSPSDQSITFPIMQYAHDGSDCTVIGGFVYRGSQFPKLYGNYIFVDYCSGRFKGLARTSSGIKRTILYVAEPFEYVSFGQDVNNELYVTDLEEGEIYHVVDSSQLRLSTTWSSDLDVALYPNPAHDDVNVEWYALSEGSCDIFVYNTLGQPVMHQSSTVANGFNHLSFDGKQFGAGNYVLEVRAKEGITKKQFQIQ